MLVKRRNFMKTAAVAAIGAPYIVPSSVFGQNAPSNRITIGHIGVGDMGNSDMNRWLPNRRKPTSDAQIVAVCDVDKTRRDDTKKRAEGIYAEFSEGNSFTGIDAYNDFRDIIARDDIDAVSIATPDHWHAIPAIMAANAGKDIYCEKPIGLTIAEGRAMSDAVKRNNVVWQTGSQQRSDRNFRFACELARNGRLGELQTIYVGLPTGNPNRNPSPVVPVPEGFDYDFWLGPAPKAPYTSDRCHWNFRWISDYSGGQLTDWAGHHIDIAHWGMDVEDTGPLTIEGRATYPKEGLWNTATEYHFECMYKNGMKLVIANSTRNTEIKQGVKFVGTEGSAFVSRRQLTADPESLLSSIIRRDETQLYRSDDHGQNFLDCVKSREATIAPIEILHRSVSVAHLGNIAMKLERKLEWNPDIERFVNDPEADRMIARSM
ncbi:Gfo/Idh/MocA family protein, partial [Candidatus Latescibacterota bacterium]